MLKLNNNNNNNKLIPLKKNNNNNKTNIRYKFIKGKFNNFIFSKYHLNQFEVKKGLNNNLNIYDGVMIIYYPNVDNKVDDPLNIDNRYDNIRIICNYKNNKLDGKFIHYKKIIDKKNNCIKYICNFECYYKDGKLDGEYKVYKWDYNISERKLVYYCNYKDDQYHGNYTDGISNIIGQFNNGIRIGTWYKYRKSKNYNKENIKVEIKYENTLRVYDKFYKIENGLNVVSKIIYYKLAFPYLIKNYRYICGYNYLYEELEVNIKLKDTIKFDQDNELDQRNKVCDISYSKLIPNGKYKLYYTNGSYNIVGYYLNGQKIGLWVKYNLDGNIIKYFNYS